ncbi:MAG: hypothetical protein IPJ77_14230 [Planctomycetes bacterium]|nr:hypothetical protein [Planctomycetota bacterium]
MLNPLPLLAALALGPQSSPASTSAAKPPKERAILYGVVGRDATMPSGCLLRVDLQKLVVEDLGAIDGDKEYSFPSDGAPDPDGKHFWVAQTRFGGAPEAWRTWLQRVDLTTRKQNRWIAVPGEVYLDALAFDAEGRLFAMNSSRVPCALVQVDLATGAITEKDEVAPGIVRGLAFHGGELWGVHEKRLDPPQHGEELLRISPVDGSVMARVALPFADDEHAMAIAFTPRGRCVLSIVAKHALPDRLVEVDRATGALTTLVTPFLVPHGMQVAVR